MPIRDDAAIEITAFRWVPEFAQGVVATCAPLGARGKPGSTIASACWTSSGRLNISKEQPFDQVPCFRDGTVKIFETGAIVQYIGEKSEKLLPRDPQGKYRAIQWTYAALNSVEPALQAVVLIDVFYGGEEWARLRRPGAEEFARLKLKRVSDWLGDKDWLEGRFTIGDLIMITTLRFLRQTDLVAEFANLKAYLERGEARPAFQRALSDQLAAYREHQPEGVAA